MHKYIEPGPAIEIKATATTTSLAISWTAPPGQPITRYLVIIKAEENRKKWRQRSRRSLTASPSKQKYVTATAATFDSLLPGKFYTVVVYSMIENVLSVAAERTFSTSKYIYISRFTFIVTHVTHSHAQHILASEPNTLHSYARHRLHPHPRSIRTRRHTYMTPLLTKIMQASVNTMLLKLSPCALFYRTISSYCN